MATGFNVLRFFVVLGLVTLASAQTFTTLYSFTGSLDGRNPSVGVIRDSSGNLYGTTDSGGDLSFCVLGCGVVYKVDTVGTETVLHVFSGPDGANPVAPLVRDKAGNLYGTTGWGGPMPSVCTHGCGTIFKVDTAGNERVLYSFSGGADGCAPLQGLIRDKAGNLYGTSSGSGCSSAGTVFKLDGQGNFTVLHHFGGYPDPVNPQGGHLTIDDLGNLFGVTTQGGAKESGALYKLSAGGKLTVLHSFKGLKKDGCLPFGSAIQDKFGNLYGTTAKCGAKHQGILWKVSKQGKETILHDFAGGMRDGCSPRSGLVEDPKGNLFGVTIACGADEIGVLYELSASGKFILLHSFDNTGGDAPVSELLRTSNGTLFGTTLGGGTGCQECGTVFSYVP